LDFDTNYSVRQGRGLAYRRNAQVGKSLALSPSKVGLIEEMQYRSNLDIIKEAIRKSQMKKKQPSQRDHASQSLLLKDHLDREPKNGILSDRQAKPGEVHKI